MKCVSHQTSCSWFYLDVVSRSIKEGGRVLFAKGLVEGKMESYCLREPVSTLQDEKVLKNWAWGLHNVRGHLTLPTAYLQMINMLNYAMCVLPQLNMLTWWLMQDWNPKALGAEAGRSPQFQARLVYREIWVTESCTAHPVLVINYNFEMAVVVMGLSKLFSHHCHWSWNK